MPSRVALDLVDALGVRIFAVEFTCAEISALAAFVLIPGVRVLRGGDTVTPTALPRKVGEGEEEGGTKRVQMRFSRVTPV